MLLATSARLTMQALAFDVVGRNAIISDENFKGGQYYGNGIGPDVGLAIARMIGHITYLSPEAMRQKFEADRLAPRDVPTEFEKKFSVGSYLGYQGDKFVERFDANSYITLSMAMDLFDLGESRADLVEALAPCPARWLVVSFTSDWLFPPGQSWQLVEALIAAGKRVSYANLASTCGHDAFLLPNDIDRYGPMVASFLANLDGAAQPARPAEEEADDETSIFHRRRVDYDQIMDLIPRGASILDLGCGSGGLLARLRRRGHSRLVGAELDEREIVRCVGRGLDVVHMDLNGGLATFADGQIDCVVLSQTLQTIRDVPGVLGDMLRVGKQCVVSFPNFAYHKLRKMLSQEGRAPEASGGLLHHSWYDSPNIRFLSIEDFRSFCKQKGIRIEREAFLDTETDRRVTDDPNLNADLAIFVIAK
jgi:homoserine O-acetyltransferase/O-succinyltransferase